MKRTILVIHGPNLNCLGEREPGLYGERTLGELDGTLVEAAKRRGYRLEPYQSNEEGKLITAIQDARKDVSGILINPAAYTHTSVGILDALLMVKVPKVEVHLTNVFARDSFRRRTITAEGVDGFIAGFGERSYLLALDALIHMIEARSAK